MKFRHSIAALLFGGEDQPFRCHCTGRRGAFRQYVARLGGQVKVLGENEGHTRAKDPRGWFTNNSGR